MLGVLLKNDIKQFWRKISVLWLVFFALSGSSMVLFPFMNTVGSIVNGFASFTYLLSVAGIFLAPLSVFLTLFSRTMFHHEAYLTHSIPSKTSTIVISKVITYALFSIVGEVFAAIVFIYIPKYVFSSYVMSDAVEKLSTYDVFEVIVETALPIYLDVFAFVLMIVLARTIAQALNTSKKSLAAAVVFILLFLLLLIITIELFNFKVIDGSYLKIYSKHMMDGRINGLYLDQIVFCIVQIVVYTIAIITVNTKKLKI